MRPAVFSRKGSVRPDPKGWFRLLVRLGLPEADNLIANFKLTARFQNLHSLEALQDVAFRGDGALTFK
jgi:hypothetical protein